VHSVTTWRGGAHGVRINQAKDEGHLLADTDPALMLFGTFIGFTLGLHHDARFLHLPDAVATDADALEKTIVRIRSNGR